MKKLQKYIFITGGVVSGIGKGVTASSIARLLQNRGYRVTSIKIDPYVNIDAGTMNPTEHGEVFVLDDGYETDQDMGNYERFVGETLTNDNYMTTGRVYASVIEKERSMKYGGACVQVVPHVPLEIIERIERATEKANAECTIIEIGGTIGEYENILFLEAARMMKARDPSSVAIVLVSYLPVLFSVGEMKTKPTQHAVRVLQSAGLWADMIVARSHGPLDKKRKEKLSFFCNVRPECVISAPDVPSIYDVPHNFEKEGVGERLIELLSLSKKRTSNEMKIGDEKKKAWNSFVKKVSVSKEEIKIAIIGKYFETGDFVLSDAYLSVIEAIKYSAYELKRKPTISWLSSEDFEVSKRVTKKQVEKNLEALKNYAGVIVPGGFGTRGIEGKIAAIQFVRENNVPYLGLCYGMQLAVIEYARHVVGISDATSKELDEKAENQVISIMESQKENMAVGKYGGNMRLGSYPAILKKGSIVHHAYGRGEVTERHRHRFEVNNEYKEDLEKAGMVFSGTSPDGLLIEYAELPASVHPFFVGTQAHPEFKARPTDPHPLFTAFLRAGIKKVT